MRQLRETEHDVADGIPARHLTPSPGTYFDQAAFELDLCFSRPTFFCLSGTAYGDRTFSASLI